VVLLGVLLSGAAFFIQNTAQPFAHRHLVSLISRELPLRVTIDLLPAGVMHEFGDWRVYIGARDGDGTLHDIMVLQPDGEGGANAFYAASARLVREDGRPVLEMRKGVPRARRPRRATSPLTCWRKPVPPWWRRSPGAPRRHDAGRAAGAGGRAGAAVRGDPARCPVAGDLLSVRIHIKNRIAFRLMCLAVAAHRRARRRATSRRRGGLYAFGAGLVILCGYFVLRKVAEPPFLASLPLTVLIGQLAQLRAGRPSRACSSPGWTGYDDSRPPFRRPAALDHLHDPRLPRAAGGGDRHPGHPAGQHRQVPGAALVVLQYYVFSSRRPHLFEFHAAAIGVLIAGLVVMGRAPRRTTRSRRRLRAG
jgi:hypothetical protein